MAFVFTFAVVIAATLLFRSLGKHLRKVRTSPPEGAPQAGGVVLPAGSSTEDRERSSGVVAQEPDDG